MLRFTYRVQNALRGVHTRYGLFFINLDAGTHTQKRSSQSHDSRGENEAQIPRTLPTVWPANQTIDLSCQIAKICLVFFVGIVSVRQKFLTVAKFCEWNRLLLLDVVKDSQLLSWNVASHFRQLRPLLSANQDIPTIVVV